MGSFHLRSLRLTNVTKTARAGYATGPGRSPGPGFHDCTQTREIGLYANIPKYGPPVGWSSRRRSDDRHSWCGNKGCVEIEFSLRVVSAKLRARRMSAHVAQA